VRAAGGAEPELTMAAGQARDAYELLVPVYSWFTESFDTTDS